MTRHMYYKPCAITYSFGFTDVSGQAYFLHTLCFIIVWPVLGLLDRCFRLGLVSTNLKALRELRETRRVRREQASPIAKVLPLIRANKTHFPFDCQGRFSDNFRPSRKCSF